MNARMIGKRAQLVRDAEYRYEQCRDDIDRFWRECITLSRKSLQIERDAVHDALDKLAAAAGLDND